MKEIYKSLFHDIFQKLIVISVFLIPCFYWPNHEPRLMKFICFQVTVNILLALSFLFTPKRTIDSFYPALFLILGFINLFLHGMSDFVNVGVSFLLMSVVAIYIISNHLHIDYVPVIKKTIVLLCLVNCVLFLLEVHGISPIFNLGEHERPSGFMCYPATFALLCGISLFLAYDWHRWMMLPIGLCLFLSHEFSVIGGVLVAFVMTSIPYMWRFKWFYVALALIGAVISYHWWPLMHDKAMLRMKYLYPVFQNVWARPIDGAGVGMYNRLPDTFFGFPRGNWSEMHCEPLDLLFCMGFLGVAVVAGWVRSVWSMSLFYKQIFAIIIITSCFHSPLHFADSLFLIIVIYALMEIERHEQPTAH